MSNRIATRLFLASALMAGLAASPSIRAEENRGATTVQPTVQTEPRPHPAGGAKRLHPEACASLCRVFEFLGALERPSPPKPIPTS